MGYEQAKQQVQGAVVLALRWRQKAETPGHGSVLAVHQVTVAVVECSVNLKGP